ncbi:MULTISPECIES: hypothetical protein [unclassified Bradyrhizobium]|uniref:hypothetical protein n=1 Tax=unclassified Bradyrhizobium TaxID=2631580 RepID=UPI002FF26CEB
MPLASSASIALTVQPPYSLQIVLLLLLAFAQALRDRGSPWDQRGFIRESLCEIGVILLHDVEHGFLGEPSMILGKKSVQVSELFVIHRRRASAAIPEIYRNLLIPRQLLTRLIVFWARSQMVIAAAAGAHRWLPVPFVNHLLTMPA